MTCAEARPLIESGVEKAQLQHAATLHLKGCVECSELLDDLETLQADLAQRPGDFNADVPFAAIRAEVMEQISRVSPWPLRLRWAASVILLSGSGLVGWQALQPESTSPITVRLQAPKAPVLGYTAPQMQRPVAVVSPPLAEPERRANERREIRLAAVIPPDAEMNRPGGMLLELDSGSPDVILYLVVDNQGDLL